MNKIMLLQMTLALGLTAASTANAQMPSKYVLTITNGSQMPLSPATIYVKDGSESATLIGAKPTPGFTQLCQTGNVTTRLNELKANASVKHTTQTMGLILPGESRTVELEVVNPHSQSIQFETMYGKSKDVCGIASINSHSLVALKQHVTTEVLLKDNVVLTGAFTEPALPQGMSYLDAAICPTANDAITCLRELSAPNKMKQAVRFFSGYSPSLIMALESKFGSTDTQTLAIPTAGAIQFKLKLKH